MVSVQECRPVVPLCFLEDQAVLGDFAALFDVEMGFTEQEIQEQFGATFDELTEIAAQNPSEKDAFTAIRSLVVEVKERGYINQAMQMAMTLGAVACSHDHMQALANEVGRLVTDGDDFGHGHSGGRHDDHSEATSHNPKTCKNCLAGKPCRKKH